MNKVIILLLCCFFLVGCGEYENNNKDGIDIQWIKGCGLSANRVAAKYSNIRLSKYYMSNSDEINVNWKDLYNLLKWSETNIVACENCDKVGLINTLIHEYQNGYYCVDCVEERKIKLKTKLKSLGR